MPEILETERVAIIARTLTGKDISALQLCSGGGNNRVYRISTTDGDFALKVYLTDDRDRIGHEFDGLAFLGANGAGRMVPAAIGVDREAGAALFEWIDGTRVTSHGLPEVGSLVTLLACTHGLRSAAGADALPVATEAWLKADELLRQIKTRLERLRDVPGESGLLAFLDNRFEPELRRRAEELGERAGGPPIPQNRRTLSPSDVGFHNALRRADGTIAFIDFEYFGWDDPVKTSADILWHPAFELRAEERHHFLSGITELYTMDPDFLARLAAFFPLAGLRWALIILNEFLPSLWARRAYAGADANWARAKAEQLEKAQAMLSKVARCRRGELA